MPDLAQATVDDALRLLGHYRVLQANVVAKEYGIDGEVMLALGLRESHLRNVNNPAKTDHGCFQISELYHLAFLQDEPGCKVGTWTPAAAHTADEPDYAPRFTPALIYACQMIVGARKYATSRGLKGDLAFAIAAYNAGIGGALNGYREGNVDRYTTGGDYSAWVLKHSAAVDRWLDDHPNWRTPAA